MWHIKHQYSRRDLWNINHHDYDCDIVTTLRKQGICRTRTHRGSRGSGHEKPIGTFITDGRLSDSFQGFGVNHANIIEVPLTNCDSPDTSSMVSCGLLNARSAKNKSEIIADCISEMDLDFLALTETWFR